MGRGLSTNCAPPERRTPAPTVAIFRNFWQSRDRRARLNQRLRQALIEGDEEDSRRRLGRGPTAEEEERVLRQYPGDLREPREK
jgi:hypothetical protein